jgi:hypothetical protein
MHSARAPDLVAALETQARLGRRYRTMIAAGGARATFLARWHHFRRSRAEWAPASSTDRRSTRWRCCNAALEPSRVPWNPAGVPQAPRHRMRKQARRADARNWIRSGEAVSIRTYRKRYGVDHYTAYDDLRALGVPLTPGDEQWAVRPGCVPKPREEPDADDEWRIAVARLPSRPSRATRKRAARQARHDAARDWIRSGAKKLDVRTYARRFGVDRYTAYADLRAIGFPLGAEAERWAVRPPKAPKRELPRHEPEEEWIIIGDQRMFVVGSTSGGAPFGYVEDIEYDMPSYEGEPF